MEKKKSKKDRPEDKEKTNIIKRLGHQIGLSDLLDDGILQYEQEVDYEDEDYEYG